MNEDIAFLTYCVGFLIGASAAVAFGLRGDWVAIPMAAYASANIWGALDMLGLIR